MVSLKGAMSSPLDRTPGEVSPSGGLSERNSPGQRDSPLSQSGERRSLARTDKHTRGQQSASVVVGSVRIKAEFDDFSYGDTCSVSPKVLAERKKYRSEATDPGVTRVKEEPNDGVFFGDGLMDPESHNPVPSPAFQLAQLAGQENVGNYGMWSHKKFGIGGFVQYGSSTRSSSLSDSPGLPKSSFPRVDATSSGHGGTSADGSPDSGHSTESRKSGITYTSPKITVKAEKSPSPKCDSLTPKSIPTPSPENVLSQSWLHLSRSKSSSPENRSPGQILPTSYDPRLEGLGLLPRHHDLELANIYPCKFCHEAFSLYTALQEHIRLEHCDDQVSNLKSDFGKYHGKLPEGRSGSAFSDGSDGKYMCKFCNCGFEYYTVLQEHIRIAHDGGRRSSSNSNTSSKMPSGGSPMVADGPSKYPCKHCDESFPLYTALQEHIRIEHGENAYWGRAAYMSMMMDGREEFFEDIMNRCDCQFCPEKFAKPALLQEHIRVEHIPKWTAQKNALLHLQQMPLLPVIKGTPHPNESVLPVQMPLAEEPVKEQVKNLLKKYVCSTCGKEYGNKLHYQVHIKSHEKEKEDIKPEIKVEPPKLPEPKLLQIPTNQDKTVNIEDLRYICEVCNARFPLYVVMQEHIRTAHGEKPFKCDLCEKEFIKRNYLMKHMKAHAEAKAQVYKCQRCDRCFMDQARLQEHAREHSNVGRFKCHVCGSCFTHKMHHDQHVRTHSGERPYKCGECSKQFSQPGPFHNHLRSHARCTHCNRTFLEKAALVLHLKTDHGKVEEANRGSPVSVASSGTPRASTPSSVAPVPARHPETDYLSPSPNEPLNLSKSSKGSSTQVNPSTSSQSGNTVSPVVFPGIELYGDLMPGISCGTAMSTTSSNSNMSMNDTSRPNSAKSDIVPEVRVPKLDLRDNRKSPFKAHEERINRSPDVSRKFSLDFVKRDNRKNFNGTDNIHRGPLSVDFLSTSSGLSCSRVSDVVKSQNMPMSSAGLKCEGTFPLTKTSSGSENIRSSPPLENLFTKSYASEYMMKYGALLHSEIFRNSQSPFIDSAGFLYSWPNRKRSVQDENEIISGDLNTPVPKVMRFDKQNFDAVSPLSEVHSVTVNGDEDGASDIDVMKCPSKSESNLTSSPGSFDADEFLLFACKNCMEILPTSEAFEVHSCHGSITVANEILSSQNGEITRMASHCDSNPSQIKLYRCHSCVEIFWAKSELLQHFEIHNLNSLHGQRFSCDNCRKSFTTSSQLFTHLQSHKSVSHHSCQVCGRLFLTKCHLVAHKENFACHESKGRNSVCQNEKFTIQNNNLRCSCGEQSDTVYDLDLHMRFCESGKNLLLNHRDVVEQSGCEEIEVDPEKSEALGCQINNHLKTGEEFREKRYECTLCKRTFSEDEKLQQHVKKHEEGTLFPCSECGRSFVSEERLEKHVKTHTERLYQCGRCHERFSTTSVLSDHVENKLCKLLTCSVCRKSFMKKSQLKCHLKTHKGVGDDGNVLQNSTRHCDVSKNSQSCFTENCDKFDNRDDSTSMTMRQFTPLPKGGVQDGYSNSEAALSD